jgi:hypothetical protein
MVYGVYLLGLIIWLLYGNSGLVTFNNGFGSEDKFWQSPSNTVCTATTHDEVERWIVWMLEHDDRVKTGTALGDLLTLVDQRLLKIQVDKRRMKAAKEYRALSDELRDEIIKIRDRAQIDKDYVRSCAMAQDSFLRPPPGPTAQSLSPVRRRRAPVLNL